MSLHLDLAPGRILAKKYQVLSFLGSGWEGEVYKLLETDTGIERAGKFFYPERNTNNRTLRRYAKKLHKLRSCGIVTQYNTLEHIVVRRKNVSFLVSEYVEGPLLSTFLASQPGKRLSPFQALHLLYALAEGLECVHDLKEYHGDLHPDNIIVVRFGLRFDLKLVDLFHWQSATSENVFEDVCDLIRIFYDAMGGAKTYSKHPKEIKRIVCGLKRTLIKKKFRSAGPLRRCLDEMIFEKLPE